MNSSSKPTPSETKTEDKSSAPLILRQLVDCLTKEFPRKLVCSDDGELKEEKIPVAPSLMLLMRSVFAFGKTYRFRLTRTATISSSGSGTLALATGVAPDQFTQYTALAALFNQCRLRQVRCRWVFHASSDLSVAAIAPFVGVFDPSWTSGTPSFASACTIPGCLLTNTDRPTVGNRSIRWSQRGTPRPFSIVASSASGSDPVGGKSGAVYHVIGAVTTASKDIGTYLLEVEYEFRNLQS